MIQSKKVISRNLQVEMIAIFGKLSRLSMRIGDDLDSQRLEGEEGTALGSTDFGPRMGQVMTDLLGIMKDWTDNDPMWVRLYEKGKSTMEAIERLDKINKQYGPKIDAEPDPFKKFGLLKTAMEEIRAEDDKLSEVLDG